MIVVIIWGAIAYSLNCTPDIQYLVSFEKNKASAKKSVTFRYENVDVSLKVTAGGKGGYKSWSAGIEVDLINNGDQQVKFDWKNASVRFATCRSFVPWHATFHLNEGTDDEEVILEPHEKAGVGIYFFSSDCGEEFIKSEYLEIKLPSLIALGDSSVCEIPIIYAFPKK